MSDIKEVEDFTKNHLKDFDDYLRIASISAQNKGIEQTSSWLVDIFNKLGADKTTKWDDQGGNPVAFASFKGKSNKTVLFYNHYDVQPPEPLDEWKSNPFEPTIRNGKLFARGICDDKGELISRLIMLEYFNEHGGLPINMKFFIEGEEEVGSGHVSDYVSSHKKELESDACIWEGGGKNEAEEFQITCGSKGILSFDLETKTANKDLHSSLAAYADNAAWRLVQALNSLKDENGHIKVEGFYDDIKPLDQKTYEVINKINFDNDKAIDNGGLKRPFVTKSPKTALVNDTTMSINGLSSGYENDGVKTIIPKYAKAKLDCRLVPNQDPKKMFDLVRKYLKMNGFNDVKITYNVGEKPFRSDLNDSFIKINEKTAYEVYGDKVSLVPNMPGGGPTYTFNDNLNVPIVLVGTRYSGSGQHAPNENIRLEDFYQGTSFMVKMLENYSV